MTTHFTDAYQRANAKSRNLTNNSALDIAVADSSSWNDRGNSRADRLIQSFERRESPKSNEPSPLRLSTGLFPAFSVAFIGNEIVIEKAGSPIADALVSNKPSPRSSNQFQEEKAKLASKRPNFSEAANTMTSASRLKQSKPPGNTDKEVSYSGVLGERYLILSPGEQLAEEPPFDMEKKAGQTTQSSKVFFKCIFRLCKQPAWCDWVS
ncbi:unnamed protein product [Protopolystoma xenopodis]|uniref:Uncharacterized protein n=1 Tax=Protopolystoma xenopodis TaxID=117903 RepID=A0A3S5FFB1_9PLAT|nr:unnamed protein product [Protopolystoma xenopodis]